VWFNVFMYLILALPVSLFSMDANYQVRVQIGEDARRFSLDFESIESLSHSCKRYSIYLNRTFLKCPSEVRTYLNLHEQSEVIKIATAKGFTVSGELFDRKSDVLLVLGSGFPTPREQMVPFLALFPDYDILCIDYVGQGLEHIPQTLLGGFTYKCFGVDMCATSFGLHDPVDLINVVKEVKKSRSYTHCYGLCLCHSAPIFVNATAMEPQLFEKLLIDGCWPSIFQVVRTIARYPSLVCGRQPPRSPCAWITDRDIVQNFACYLVEKMAKLKLADIPSVQALFPSISIPVLLFQSRQDCYCSLEQFEDIWNAIRSDKIAVTTPHLHGKNYLDAPEIYHMIATRFFESATVSEAEALLLSC
jgi:hypothetical protein